MNHPSALPEGNESSACRAQRETRPEETRRGASPSLCNGGRAILNVRRRQGIVLGLEGPRVSLIHIATISRKLEVLQRGLR
eukprot:6800469-Pyramimonas_sp.AAC.1